MKMQHGWAAAALAVTMLNAGPGQAQDRSCDDGRGGLITDLGFRHLTPRMQVESRNGRTETRFDSEPRISGVRADGPAAERLRDGDVLVAVDGQPITTPEGARRYSEIRAGAPVRLSVRRADQVQDVTLTADELCIPHPPAPPAPPAPPPPPAPPADELMPEGWFGFRISCQNCGDHDGTGAFRFREPPVIASVEPNSPAARAGLRVGDRLTHVDGVPLTSATGWPQWSAIRPGQQVQLTYTRGGQPHQIMISAQRRH